MQFSARVGTQEWNIGHIIDLNIEWLLNAKYNQKIRGNPKVSKLHDREDNGAIFQNAKHLAYKNAIKAFQTLRPSIHSSVCALDWYAQSKWLGNSKPVIWYLGFKSASLQASFLTPWKY